MEEYCTCEDGVFKQVEKYRGENADAKIEDRKYYYVSFDVKADKKNNNKVGIRYARVYYLPI